MGKSAAVSMKKSNNNNASSSPMKSMSMKSMKKVIKSNDNKKVPVVSKLTSWNLKWLGSSSMLSKCNVGVNLSPKVNIAHAQHVLNSDFTINPSWRWTQRTEKNRSMVKTKSTAASTPIDPDDPTTWGERITGNRNVGLRARQNAWKLDPKVKKTVRGNIQKKMGRPSKTESEIKRQLDWANVKDKDDSDLEVDCNPWNIFLRFVYFSKANPKFSLGPLLNQFLPKTWNLVDAGRKLESNPDFQYELQFSGHVRNVKEMDALLNEVLSTETKKGNIQQYRVLDQYRPAIEAKTSVENKFVIFHSNDIMC